jgi:hypothetical protein
MRGLPTVFRSDRKTEVWIKSATDSVVLISLSYLETDVFGRGTVIRLTNAILHRRAGYTDARNPRLNR